MSAIGGVFTFSKSNLTHNPAAAMSAALVHRGETQELISAGTDSHFFYRNKHKGVYQAGLTHSGSTYVLVDGRARTPEDGVLSGQSLSDYIHAAYQKHGVKALADLDGGFAVCIYNTHTGRIVLGRDLFARRPLYYAQQDNHFWFASEVKAILNDPQFKRRVNTENLLLQLTYRGNWGPQTLFQDVFKVVPGFVVTGTVHGNTPLSLQPNLKQEPVKKIQARAEQFTQPLWRRLCLNITDQFRNADLRRSADVRPGLLMSGGIDSALIGAAQRECGLHKTTAISCGYSDPEAREYDETRVAQQNAKRHGLVSQNVTIDAQDDLLALLRRTVLSTEEPPRTFISLATERALEQLQGELDVLMTGTCADILFGEQPQHDVPIYGLRKRCPPAVWKLVRRTIPLLQRVPRLRGYAAWFKRGDVTSMKQYLLRNQQVNENLRQLFNTTGTEDCAEHIDQLQPHLAALHPEDEYTLVGTLMFAHCFNEMFESIGSHNGVDVVHPFQSNSLHRLSLQMPYRHKVSRKHTKPCLRALAEKHYSKQFAYQKKTKFTSPGTVWFAKSLQLQAAAHRLSKPDARLHQYLNGHTIRRIVNEYEDEVASGKLSQQTSQLIYTLVGFEVWLNTFFPQQNQASKNNAEERVHMSS